MSDFLRVRALFVLMNIMMMGVLVACGAEATPRPTFEPTATFERQVVEVEEEAEDVVVVAQEPTEPETEVMTEGEESDGEVVQEETEEPTLTPEPSTPTPEPAPTSTPEPTEEPEAEPAGDPAYGEFLFNNQPSSTTEQMCITCHNPTEPEPGTGPYLYGIANVAGERVEGLSAREYLYQSIVNPDEFIAPPQEGQEWNEGVMPASWEEDLSEDDINAIVDYLMTLDQPLE